MWTLIDKSSLLQRINKQTYLRNWHFEKLKSIGAKETTQLE